jgi:2-dehydro-3-deoxyphosphogluconate aldolase/(4S)-4-hydroxy-2-oxoglutarate aldolase
LPDVLTALGELRLIPVITIDDPRHAWPLLQALKAGGLPCAEVTFRTPAAEDALRIMAEDHDVLLGAGSVLHPSQVDRALAAGARYIITPGFSPSVARACADQNVPVIPGVATATEICRALEAGLGTMKLFPAELLGRLRLIAALHAPYPAVRFVPTGGIGPQQLPGYLAHPAVTAVGGSWMATSGLITHERFDEITRLTAAAVDLTRRSRPKAAVRPGGSVTP